MSNPTHKPIQLDEASCLKAVRDNIKIAVIQPQGQLYISDDLAPHYYTSDIEEADLRACAFLKLIREQEVCLAIEPEYFTPISTIQKILEDPELLLPDCLYVLPIETV